MLCTYTHDQVCVNPVEELVYAESGPSIAMYSRSGDMAQSLQFALDFAEAFSAEVDSGRYGEIMANIVRPPRFNYRLTDYVFFAEGNGDVKIAAMNSGTINGIFSPPPQVWHTGDGVVPPIQNANIVARLPGR